MRLPLTLRWKFDIVIGASKNIPPKPDPSGALEIAKKLQLASESILYMGDSGVDMKTANAAPCLLSVHYGNSAAAKSC